MSKRGRQGEGGGRPPKFKTEEELNKAIDIYFKKAQEEGGISNKAGLFHWLDIDRSTWFAYSKKYPNTIRNANMWIESVWVTRLAGTGATGAIFYLKNAFKEDYKDRTETDITSGGKKIQPILGGLSRKKE